MVISLVLHFSENHLVIFTLLLLILNLHDKDSCYEEKIQCDGANKDSLHHTVENVKKWWFIKYN